MDTNKLGLKIVLINNGTSDSLEVNGDTSWTKKIWDLRMEIPEGTNVAEGKTALLLSSIESGTFITIAALIDGGRGNDCIAAWIFVPKTVEVTGKQIVDVIDATKKELIKNERDEEKLRRLFDEDYPPCDAEKLPLVNTGEQFAYRKYGIGTKFQLYELLDNPNQPDYQQYKGVFLIDNDSGIAGRGDDLSDRQLRKYVKVLPVSDIHGFKAYIGDTPMDKPIFLMNGDVVTINWQRSGYKQIDKKWTVEEGTSVTGIGDADYCVWVPYSRFIVRDVKDRRQIEQYTLKVNDIEFNRGYKYPVQESTIENSLVSVEASGYQLYKKNCNLKNGADVYIELERIQFAYDFKIESRYAVSRYATLHIESYEKLNGRSPIEGYDRHDREGNRFLKYRWIRLGKKRMLLAALIILLVTFLIGLAGGMTLSTLTRKDKDSGKDGITLNQEQNPTNQKNPNEDSGNGIKTVIKYLDSKAVWNRTEMERFTEIQGLWDALNERRFDDILKYKEKLHGSNKFNELVSAINANKHKNFSNHFNTNDNDYDITIGSKDGGGYIKKLYDAIEPGNSSGTTKSKTETSENVIDDNQNIF